MIMILRNISDIELVQLVHMKHYSILEVNIIDLSALTRTDENNVQSELS